jgi:hypothetical protein
MSRRQPIRPSALTTPRLFEEPEPDCTVAHDWQPTVTTWLGETIERLTWTCRRCGEIRGRC